MNSSNQKLWEPTRSQIENSHVTELIKKVSNKYKITFQCYQEFYIWSIENIEKFWEEVWEFCDIKASLKYNCIIQYENFEPGIKWFEGARLNFAENLLRYCDDHPAIVFWNEEGRNSQYSYKELNLEVGHLTRVLKSLSLNSTDRVAGFLPNIPQAIVAMLATTACGASWSSCSPDFSAQGVIDRFSQIEPKVLFCADSYLYKGKRISIIDKVEKIVSNLPTLREVVVIPYFKEKSDISSISKGIHYEDFIKRSDDKNPSIIYQQVEAQHPLYILFSSGTTGAPKCIVHSVGGILLEHLKELKFEINLNREDKIFYNTTCGWMMWNWLTSGLALGATLLLYDGFALEREGEILLDLVEQEKVTIFGTSAGYIQKLEELGLEPKSSHDLSSLRSVYTTGSRLKAHSFDYFYDAFGYIQISPIWGGTDLCGCLGTASPILPVYRDKLQTRGLGLAVDVVNDRGGSVRETPGEVVVKKPFPSTPLGFLNDTDNVRFKATYFNKYPAMWHHGDWAILSQNGGMTILGRSDDTLNPGGVRIGSAEITSAAERIDGVIEAMAVSQDWEGDERIILFIITKAGVILDDKLQKAIIAEMPSPRHRPKKIIAVAELPTTLNGKRSARAVRDAINGREVLNREALLNPQLLEAFAQLKELKE